MWILSWVLSLYLTNKWQYWCLLSLSWFYSYLMQLQVSACTQSVRVRQMLLSSCSLNVICFIFETFLCTFCWLVQVCCVNKQWFCAIMLSPIQAHVWLLDIPYALLLIIYFLSVWKLKCFKIAGSTLGKEKRIELCLWGLVWCHHGSLIFLAPPCHWGKSFCFSLTFCWYGLLAMFLPIVVLAVLFFYFKLLLFFVYEHLVVGSSSTSGKYLGLASRFVILMGIYIVNLCYPKLNLVYV